MNEEAVQKAYNILAMHHNELLLENQRLREQLRNIGNISIWRILKLRWNNLFRRNWYD
jgi:hypothetical protein